MLAGSDDADVHQAERVTVSGTAISATRIVAFMQGRRQRRPVAGTAGDGVRGGVPLALYFYFIISLQFQINPVPEGPADFRNTVQGVMPIFWVRGSAATPSPRSPYGAK